MTAIVYRDGVMAADSVAMNYGVRVPCHPKITRKGDGTLIGVSAHEAPARWFSDAWPDIDRDKAPPLTEGDFYALIVKPNGDCLSCDHHLVPFPLKGDFHVLGRCGQFLLGALHHGASAAEAVRLAIEHTTEVGGPIQIERLK